MKTWLLNILIALDQLANAILAGDPDETISSRVGKRIRSDQATRPERWLARLLDLLDHNHVEEAIEEDEGNDETLKKQPEGGNNNESKY